MEQKDKSVEEHVLEYMNTRYTDRFKDPVPVGGYTGSVYRQYLVTSENLGKTVTVEIFDPGGEKEHFWDNYVGLVYEGQAYERLRRLIAEVFSVGKEDLVLFWKPSSVGVADHWDAGTTLEEYMGDPEAEIGVTAVLKKEIKKEERAVLEERLREIMDRECVCCSGWLYFVPDETDLTELTAANVYEKIIFRERYQVSLFYLMKVPAAIFELTWREGGGVRP